MPKLTDLLNAIDGLMGSVNFNIPILPPKLIQCGVLARPGISKIRAIQSMVENMASYGLPISDNSDGTPNEAIPFGAAIINAVFDEVLKNAVVQTPVQVGEATITVPGILT
jgi:hypothetical protein